MVQWVKGACYQSLRTLVQIPINHTKGIFVVHSCNDSILVGREQVGTGESLRVLGHQACAYSGEKEIKQEKRLSFNQTEGRDRH